MPLESNGLPGVSSARTATYRRVFKSGTEGFAASSFVINGSLSRDAGNTGDVDVLRAGKLMGKITATGLYAPSVIGVTGEAIDNTETVVDIAAGVATEIIRRIGSTGTVKIVGPPTAAGTVRAVTATFSAVGATSITITALGINEVQTINFGAAATGGTFKIGFTLASGAVVWTDTIAWSATDATFLSNINTAIDNLLGAGLVVATAIAATDTDLGFVLTFSGAGYTALPQSLVAIDAAALTSVTTVTVTRTTTGQDGRFVTGSFICPTDGSETPLTFISDGFGVKVTDEFGSSQSTPFGEYPISGMIDSSQLIDWPADTSLQTWVANALSVASGGKFTFDHIQ